MTRPEVLPIYSGSVSRISGELERRNAAYQENDRDVQGKCDESVEEEHKVSDLLDFSPSHVGNLDKQADDSVHDGTCRRKVV